MKFRVRDPEVVVEHEPRGFNGAGAITIMLAGVKFRVTLEDAESLGDALIECVRRAEAETKVKR